MSGGGTFVRKVGADLGSHLLASGAKAACYVWLCLILLANRQERVRETRLDSSAPLIDIRHVACDESLIEEGGGFGKR